MSSEQKSVKTKAQTKKQLQTNTSTNAESSLNFYELKAFFLYARTLHFHTYRSSTYYIVRVSSSFFSFLFFHTHHIVQCVTVINSRHAHFLFSLSHFFFCFVSVFQNFMLIAYDKYLLNKSTKEKLIDS